MTEYAIMLNNDTNTRGYNQWFHFHIKSKNNMYMSGNTSPGYMSDEKMDY